MKRRQAFILFSSCEVSVVLAENWSLCFVIYCFAIQNVFFVIKIYIDSRQHSLIRILHLVNCAVSRSGGGGAGKLMLIFDI